MRIIIAGIWDLGLVRSVVSSCNAGSIAHIAALEIDAVLDVGVRMDSIPASPTRSPSPLETANGVNSQNSDISNGIGIVARNRGH
ncbi:hypothetical protein L596_009051 [Steinernema carpocapsae]|uniref:Uncharacterized protein n=1 Tax=Steinernema carpocapsae TaxID=34508 RepID=A0A4V6A6J0_STECR|nr:hypothetical protein L596_009051 [Steinernema carpocapsae]